MGKIQTPFNNDYPISRYKNAEPFFTRNDSNNIAIPVTCMISFAHFVKSIPAFIEQF